MPLESYKELTVRKRSMELAQEIYQLTVDLPKSETYGLASQMRRVAVSIPSNIAEGYKRNGTKEYLRFLSIAEGSGAELETQILLAKRIYSTVSCENALLLLEEVQKMLFSLIKKLHEKMLL